ncbi:hypothetical protein GGI25_000265 [Coemansia spiralis]|uniref:Uncharacterized protein n=2 Tax=Coemansia TaxID=4863 RepID=A0A9W8G8J7_9FUNG|nr:hypothetical protein BX070DRAFT_227435 [Coemansia spiralis]KAJ1995859.1 hypothetical protein EDC05_000517 [Coemansia umbellata]KAJ2625837.1 hypothetical protein GGI26_000300 [Coemansia sp. RSA 1358]KAJ2680959.1 hypothetical protein GGI25_000265 [Coemansia spiralis]
MRTFTAIFVAASTVLGQEIGFSGGDNLSTGTNAISNPNVNNGWQADSSLFAGAPVSGSGVTTFNDVVGSSFTNVNSNTAIKDNLVNNPSATLVKGNDGWTANGDHNSLGPVQNLFGRSPVFRRSGDVVFADNHHQVQSQLTTGQIMPAHVIQPGFVAPVFRRNGEVVFTDNHHQVESQVTNGQAVPAHIIQPGFVSPFFAAPQFVAAHPAPVAVTAAPVLKRDGDIVFADNHHRVESATVVSPAFVPAAAGWAVGTAPEIVTPVVHHVNVQPAVVESVAPQAFIPVSAQQNGQKATIVQNQA